MTATLGAVHISEIQKKKTLWRRVAYVCIYSARGRCRYYYYPLAQRTFFFAHLLVNVSVTSDNWEMIHCLFCFVSLALLLLLL